MIKQLAFLFLYVCFYSVGTIAYQEERVLQVGESIRIKSPPSAQTWLSQGGVIFVSDRGNFLWVQARKKGKVLLRTGGRLYHIYVVSSENKDHFVALEKLLYSKKGLKVGFAGDLIQITGHLYRFKDFKDISFLAQKRNFPYLFRAEIPIELRTHIRDYLHRRFKKILNGFSFLWEKPLTILVSKEHPLTKVQKNTFQQHGVQVVMDSSILYKPPLIELKLLLVGNSLNNSINIHFPWENNEEGNVVTRILDGNFFQNWWREFKAMENKGHAKILSQAVLLNESGKNSRFLSGGEVPIPHYHPESDTQTIKWKPYGIQLSFDTRADRTQTIHIKVEAEISEVNYSHSAHTTPSLKINRVHSSVTMKSGQTLSLSSLIRKQGGKTLSAPLVVSQTPFIGRFFSLKGKVIDNTRLNIFVTAKIL